MTFTGKRCLVTGGSRGLGRAIALELARAGARVAITYRSDDGDAAEARRLITEAGAEPLVFKGSVADPAHVAAVTKELAARWEGIDVLVAAAGVMQVLPLALIEASDWDEVMDVNVKGAFLFARAVAKPMIRAKGGRILFVGNFASERIVESPVHFAASKSALRGLCEALAREVGRYGVTVNLLAPGLLESGLATMLPRHRIDEYLEQCPMGRLGRLDEAARVALFLLSEEAAFVTGAKVAVDGGL